MRFRLRKRTRATVCLGLVLAAPMAHAQTVSSDGGDADDTTKPASAGSQAGQETEEAGEKISDEARKHFKLGILYLDDPEGPRYEEAYLAFQAAYEATPSPKILGNIAFCAMKLERLGEAIDGYSRYIERVPDVLPRERAQILRDLAVMRAASGELIIEVNVDEASLEDARASSGGKLFVNRYPLGMRTTLRVQPGRHSLVVSRPGYEPFALSVDLQPGESVRRMVNLRRPAPARPLEQPPEESSSWVPYGLIGAGGVLAIGGTVTGLVAQGKAAQIREDCPDQVCSINYPLSAKRSSVETLSVTTDGLFAAGVLSAAVGVVWLIWPGSKGAPSATAASTSVSWVVEPWNRSGRFLLTF